MAILIDEKHSCVIYHDNLTTIVDSLMKETNRDYTEFLKGNVTRMIEATDAIIRATDDLKVFLVEGYDNLYFVNGGDARQLSKEWLYEQTVKKALLDDVIEVARMNGYDVTNMAHSEKVVLKAACMILRNVQSEEAPIRIPYPFDPDYNFSVPDGDWSNMPLWYEISGECKQQIIETMEGLVHEQLLANAPNDFKVYSYNWFVSKLKRS